MVIRCFLISSKIASVFSWIHCVGVGTCVAVFDEEAEFAKRVLFVRFCDDVTVLYAITGLLASNLDFAE